MNSTLILIVSSLGIAQGIFWSLLFLSGKKKGYQHLILGLLLFAFSIRMLKSVLFVHDLESPLWFMNVGFAVHLFVGPLLLAYTKGDKSSAQWSKHLIHYIPGFIVLLLSFNLTLERFWYQGGYSALLIQSLVYLTWSLRVLKSRNKSVTAIDSNWSYLLHAGVGIVLLVYFCNYILRIIDYSWGPVSFSLVIYGWSYYLVLHYREMHNQSQTLTKYKNLEKLSPGRIIEVREKLATHFENGTTHLDPEYSLSKLSNEIKVPKHLISKVLNMEMKVSFNEFVNKHRVAFAKNLLSESPYLTIASIAFDSGFNSLSTFNQAFKKITGTTPSVYRETKKTVEV